MVSDFFKGLEEVCKGRKMSPTDKEIDILANKIYFSLKDGAVKRSVRSTAIKLVKKIKPWISDHELIVSGMTIELIVIATLCEFLSCGEIISIKEKQGGS